METMKINGLDGTNMQAGAIGMSKATDSVSKNIQSQIANAQKKLQNLSSNEDMSIEEKMKKRQEIQQEITNLNQQLRQHQIEQRKEEQAKKSTVQDLTGGETAKKTTTEDKGLGFSQAGMQAMVSAGSSLKQAKIQGSTVTKMEGRAGILESEIKLDAQRGMDTQKKEEELADVQQKAQKATASQLGTLAEATETMQEAAQTNRQNGDAEVETAEKSDKGNASGETEVSAEKDNEANSVRGIGTYTPVDVYV